MTRKKNKSKKKTKRRPRKARQPLRQEIELDELEGILERARASLSEDEHKKLKAAIETLAFITRELESKRVSLKRLKKLLFGASTEKTSQVFRDAAGEAADEAGSSENTERIPGVEKNIGEAKDLMNSIG